MTVAVISQLSVFINSLLNRTLDTGNIVLQKTVRGRKKNRSQKLRGSLAEASAEASVEAIHKHASKKKQSSEASVVGKKTRRGSLAEASRKST